MKPETLKVTEVDYIKLDKMKIPSLIRAMSTKPYIPGTCKGDSGGPLMKLDVTSGKYEVVGVVFGKWRSSEGPRGCLDPMSYVYTKISDFVPWIKESMTKSDSLMQLYKGEWIKFICAI